MEDKRLESIEGRWKVHAEGVDKAHTSLFELGHPAKYYSMRQQDIHDAFELIHTVRRQNETIEVQGRKIQEMQKIIEEQRNDERQFDLRDNPLE